MMQNELATAPRVVTILMPKSLQAELDLLRETHFPNNQVPAHISLLHAVPATQAGALHGHLTDLCARTQPFALSLPRLVSLGRGVALKVEAPALRALHGCLVDKMGEHITNQDRAALAPHVTLANKLSPPAARALLADLAPRWLPRQSEALGFVVWHYLGGPWKLERVIPFAVNVSPYGSR